MHVAFRVDASLQIGIGHVMRCLTLAEMLRKNRVAVVFISRVLPGNMIDAIERRGFPVDRLPPPDNELPEAPPAHAPWAGVHWEDDMKETAVLLETRHTDWLIVDHYAFDERWEKSLRRRNMQIMVVDDLADRPHDCDMILDQNLGRNAADYENLVPGHCRRLIGPRYALLRPEFAEKRSESLFRRKNTELEHIFVSMGGVDQDNITCRVMEAIQKVEMPLATRITVVLGQNAPWYQEINSLAKNSKVRTTVLRGVDDMAALMSEADFAIGGAGVSTWERCSVGLPTMLFTMAENQALNAHSMASEGAAQIIACGGDLRESFQKNLAHAFNTGNLQELSERSAKLCDGDGTSRVLAEIMPVELSFRDAKLEDSRRIWEWRQYPGRERFNKNRLEPDFYEHHEWFATALSDSDRRYRIVQLGRLSCGYLRLDRNSASCGSISICLSVDARGRKLSRAVLREGDRIALEMGLKNIDAEVHVENQASIRAFEAAGYVIVVDSSPFIRYQRKLENAA